MAQQGPPPGRPPRDYPSLDELSPGGGRGGDRGQADSDRGPADSDRGPAEHDRGAAEQGAHDHGRAERSLRPRRAERPERQGWESADPFAPGADADLPSWAPPSEFPTDRPPTLPRRPGRNRPEDADGGDDGRSFRRLGHRRPDGDGMADRQLGYNQSGYNQSGYGQPGSGEPGSGQGGSRAARPGRRRADGRSAVAGSGYERPARATSHRLPSYEEQSQSEQGHAQQGYADQGYAQEGHADQGYAHRGYADQGYAERPSGSHHRPDGEGPSGSHHRPDGERPSGSHHRPDGERSSGSHHRPDASAVAYQQPATDWRDTDPRSTDPRSTDPRSTDPRSTDPRDTDARNFGRTETDWREADWREADRRDSGEFERAAPGYGRPDYARKPDGDRPGPDGIDRDRSRHGRPGYDAADDGYNGARTSGGPAGAHYSGRDPHAGATDARSADTGARPADADARSADTDTDTDTDAGAGVAGARARSAGLPGRLGLPGRVGRGRAAAARLRKSRRKVYRWSGVGIAVCVVVALVVVLTHHSPKPLPYVTTLLAGEFKSVPGACNSVSATVLNQYLPEPGRTTADQMSGSTESECSFTVDRKPVFLELNVTAQAFQPFAPATAAGSKPGSATAYAADSFTEAQQGLAHPLKTAPQSAARILPLAKVGQQAFVAVASQQVTGIESEIVTVVVRERNVLITVAETGQESGHGFGPVSAGELEAGALAAAKNVLAKAEKQPTA